MKRKITAIILILGILLLCSCSSKAIYNPSDFDYKILNLINNARLENNLNELKIDYELNRSAFKRCNYIIATNSFSHPASLAGFIKNNTGHTIKVGEILARSKFEIESEEYIKAWLNSYKHKDTMLNSEYRFERIGIASINWNGNKLVVVLFSSN